MAGPRNRSRLLFPSPGRIHGQAADLEPQQHQGGQLARRGAPTVVAGDDQLPRLSRGRRLRRPKAADRDSPARPVTPGSPVHADGHSRHGQPRDLHPRHHGGHGHLQRLGGRVRRVLPEHGYGYTGRGSPAVFPNAFLSSSCDFGTGADDNTCDVLTVAGTTYTYGDDETFTCDLTSCF